MFDALLEAGQIEDATPTEGFAVTVEELVGAVALLALAGLAGWQWLQRRRAKK